jgi:uncharacterized protein YndB with AHSA1/START domain
MTAKNEGTLQTAEPRAVIRFERRLDRSPQDVWRAITDREELKAWFPNDVVVDAWEVGATIDFTFTEHDLPPFTGTVLEVDEPKVLAYTWGEETLRFELTPDGDGTLLVLTDELDRGFAARNAAGWEICLDRLADASDVDDDWRPKFARYVAEFEPALGPQEGPPPGVN